jgi:hypothetical protein
VLRRNHPQRRFAAEDHRAGLTRQNHSIAASTEAAVPDAYLRSVSLIAGTRNWLYLLFAAPLRLSFLR